MTENRLAVEVDLHIGIEITKRRKDEILARWNEVKREGGLE